MLIEKILPTDYYVQMMGVSADVKYFGEVLLEEYLPDVHQKFRELNFNPSFFSLNWFTCLF
jgi:Rab-GTPase-TBC domain